MTIDLPPLGAVEGEVMVNDQPGRQFLAVLRADGSRTPGTFARSRGTVVDDRGHFSFAGVSGGDYTLRLIHRATRREVHREAVTVVADTTSRVFIRLSLGGLSGRIERGADSSTDPMDGTLTVLPGAVDVPLDLREYGRTRRVHVLRVRDGGFRDDFLTSGPALLILRIRGRERVVQPIEIPWRTTREIVLRAGGPDPH